VGSNTEVVGWETSPESSKALTSDGFSEAVGDTRVRDLTISSGLLLLNLCLNVIERKRDNSSCYGSDHR
jgi:hypothetical protein